jgi:hypothetical protein
MFAFLIRNLDYPNISAAMSRGAPLNSVMAAPVFTRVNSSGHPVIGTKKVIRINAMAPSLLNPGCPGNDRGDNATLKSAWSGNLGVIR